MSKSEKRRIDSIVRNVERVIGASQPSVDSVFLDLVRGKLETGGVIIATLSMDSYGVS